MGSPNLFMYAYIIYMILGAVRHRHTLKVGLKHIFSANFAVNYAFWKTLLCLEIQSNLFVIRRNHKQILGVACLAYTIVHMFK